jgi:hypothetical protein
MKEDDKYLKEMDRKIKFVESMLPVEIYGFTNDNVGFYWKKDEKAIHDSYGASHCDINILYELAGKLFHNKMTIL